MQPNVSRTSFTAHEANDALSFTGVTSPVSILPWFGSDHKKKKNFKISYY